MPKLFRKCHYELSTALTHVSLMKQYAIKYHHILYLTHDHCFLLVHSTKGQCSCNNKIINIYTSVKHSPISYFLNSPFKRGSLSSIWLESCTQTTRIHCLLFSTSITLKGIQPATPNRVTPPVLAMCLMIQCCSLWEKTEVRKRQFFMWGPKAQTEESVTNWASKTPRTSIFWVFYNFALAVEITISAVTSFWGPDPGLSEDSKILSHHPKAHCSRLRKRICMPSSNALQ